MCSSRDRRRASCKVGSAKIGRISSNKIPGEGKSGNWRRDERILTLRLASSVVREGWGEDCPATWEAAAFGGIEGESDDWDMMKREKKRKGKRGKEKKKENRKREGDQRI